MNWNRLIAIVAVLACFGSSFAQGPGRGGGRGGMIGGQWGGQMGGANGMQLLGREDVQAELKITDEQKTKLGGIRDGMQTRMRERMMGGAAGGERMSREAMQEAGRKMFEEVQKEIDGILNADQQKRLKELTIQRAGNGAINMPDVAKALNLTEDQKTKIKGLNDRVRQANQAIMERARNQEIEFSEVREKTTANSKILNDEIGKVLTEEQRKKLADMGGKKFEFKESN